jgi:hypothetical protein
MNHGCLKFTLIDSTNFTLSQQPTITMDTPKNLKPNKENKMVMRAYYP